VFHSWPVLHLVASRCASLPRQSGVSIFALYLGGLARKYFISFRISGAVASARIGSRFEPGRARYGAGRVAQRADWKSTTGWSTAFDEAFEERKGAGPQIQLSLAGRKICQ
jgi:hypothetical protein